MHDTFESLSDDLRDVLTSTEAPRQHWLGIVGPPGSGKSTLSRELLAHIGDEAIVVPMDGYHLYRSELDLMADPAMAHQRRGAPFTFNARRFVNDLTRALRSGSGTFPSFQHGVGDPIENTIHLDLEIHRLVIVEGNYLLLNDDPWCQLQSLFDETWYLDVETDILRKRLHHRFITNGMLEQDARHRVESNDIPNANLIAEHSRSKAGRILNLIESEIRRP